MAKIGSKACLGILGLGFQPSVGVFQHGESLGLGLAELAAAKGHQVVLYDKRFDTLSAAKESLKKAFAARTACGEMKEAEAAEALSRIKAAQKTAEFSDCDLVFEAIVEKLSAKQEAVLNLEKWVSEDCILASTTASLSLSAIASACHLPGRVLGTHFSANSELVEIIAGLNADWSNIKSAAEFISSWGLSPVTSKDLPGFVAGRLRRAFFSEALLALEDGVADAATIDWAVRELGGIAKGPFEAIDSIGLDVDLAASEAMFEAFYYEPRFRSSLTERRMVDAGQLGVKAGCGFYDYREGATAAEPLKNKKLGDTICRRILAVCLNEASLMLLQGVASAEDIDKAASLGLSFSKGVLKWADEFGIDKVFSELENLQKDSGRSRYSASLLLTQKAKAGEGFFA